MAFAPPDLPVLEALPAVVAALRDGTSAILVAPPGAGKTTLIPLMLVDERWLERERIVMLEPRRLATRAAAQRMATLLGERVGDTVGYQTRDERHIGPRHADRGRHRGGADATSAARPDTRGLRPGDLRRGARAQPSDRPRARPRARRARAGPARAQAPRHVGNAGHQGSARGARPRHTDRPQRRTDAPGRDRVGAHGQAGPCRRDDGRARAPGRARATRRRARVPAGDR